MVITGLPTGLLMVMIESVLELVTAISGVSYLPSMTAGVDLS